MQHVRAQFDNDRRPRLDILRSHSSGKFWRMALATTTTRTSAAAATGVLAGSPIPIPDLHTRAVRVQDGWRRPPRSPETNPAEAVACVHLLFEVPGFLAYSSPGAGEATLQGQGEDCCAVAEVVRCCGGLEPTVVFVRAEVSFPSQSSRVPWVVEPAGRAPRSS